jgi:hypothetical protein
MKNNLLYVLMVLVCCVEVLAMEKIPSYKFNVNLNDTQDLALIKDVNDFIYQYDKAQPSIFNCCHNSQKAVVAEFVATKYGILSDKIKPLYPEGKPRQQILFQGKLMAFSKADAVTQAADVLILDAIMRRQLVRIINLCEPVYNEKKKK